MSKTQLSVHVSHGVELLTFKQTNKQTHKQTNNNHPNLCFPLAFSCLLLLPLHLAPSSKPTHSTHLTHDIQHIQSAWTLCARSNSNSHNTRGTSLLCSRACKRQAVAWPCCRASRTSQAAWSASTCCSFNNTAAPATVKDSKSVAMTWNYRGLGLVRGSSRAAAFSTLCIIPRTKNSNKSSSSRMKLQHSCLLTCIRACLTPTFSPACSACRLHRSKCSAATPSLVLT